MGLSSISAAPLTQRFMQVGPAASIIQSEGVTTRPYGRKSDSDLKRILESALLWCLGWGIYGPHSSGVCHFWDRSFCIVSPQNEGSNWCWRVRVKCRKLDSTGLCLYYEPNGQLSSKQVLNKGCFASPRTSDSCKHIRPGGSDTSICLGEKSEAPTIHMASPASTQACPAKR